MTACGDKQRMLARLADSSEADPLTAAERAAMEGHLSECAGCRTALQEQRLVAGILRARPQLGPSPSFAPRLAARLDDASSWLGMLDWRVWTFRLAPVALAIAFAALFAGTPSSTSDTTFVTSGATLDSWTRSVAEPSSVASAVWQEGTSSDALLETMLTGASGTPRETGDVR